VTIAGAGTFTRDVDLNLNLNHTFSSDMDVTLRSPAGTVVTITTDNGGSNDNVFAGTLFNDDADPDGQLPFATNANSVTDHPYVDLTLASPLTPEEALSAFIGENPNGVWTLTISDDATQNGGTLNSWSLNVVTCECGAGVPCPGDIDGNDAVNVNDLLAVVTTWGPCPGCPPATCLADIAPPGGNCVIDVNDLLQVITTWGACP
jgi:subtilisin-like proprotein convertase family protein